MIQDILHSCLKGKWDIGGVVVRIAICDIGHGGVFVQKCGTHQLIIGAGHCPWGDRGGRRKFHPGGGGKSMVLPY